MLNFNTLENVRLKCTPDHPPLPIYKYATVNVHSFKKNSYRHTSNENPEKIQLVGRMVI